MTACDAQNSARWRAGKHKASKAKRTLRKRSAGARRSCADTAGSAPLRHCTARSSTRDRTAQTESPSKRSDTPHSAAPHSAPPPLRAQQPLWRCDATRPTHSPPTRSLHARESRRHQTHRQRQRQRQRHRLPPQRLKRLPRGCRASHRRAAHRPSDWAQGGAVYPPAKAQSA